MCKCSGLYINLLPDCARETCLAWDLVRFEGKTRIQSGAPSTNQSCFKLISLGLARRLCIKFRVCRTTDIPTQPPLPRDQPVGRWRCQSRSLPLALDTKMQGEFTLKKQTYETTP
jgi:hypothetical protein